MKSNMSTRFVKIILAAVALSAFSLNIQAQEKLPEWAQKLMDENPALIDSIYYYNVDPNYPDTRTYIIYYHQPLKHTQPYGAQFPLRALITVNPKNDPAKAVNHVYVSGYNIEGEFLNYPDSLFQICENNAVGEIAHRYHANFIQLEHRYFQFSAPAECWTILDDLRAEEAAADFHNLFDALKKVLKGKYAMSGMSKGGITTLLQHKFYPSDMDIFVPYSAPFFNTDRDLEMQKYWYNNGLTKEFRDMFMTIRRNGLARKETILPIYIKMRGGAMTEAQSDSLYWYYLLSIMGFGFEEHAYSDTASLRAMIYRNDSIMRATGVEAYGDTVYGFMFHKSKFDLSLFPVWLDTLRKYPEPNQAPEIRCQYKHQRPFGITYKEWFGGDSIKGAAYEYQAKCELGYYDYRFDLIIEDAELAKQYNDYWVKNAGCVADIYNPYYRSLTFSPALYNETMTATKNATKPILLIYGEDDTWAGAAVKDEFVNGTNVRKFILPAQNHLASFSSNSDRTKCDAIRAALDAVLASPQGIEETIFESSNPRIFKYIKNGQLLIEHNSKTYTITGQETR